MHVILACIAIYFVLVIIEKIIFPLVWYLGNGIAIVAIIIASLLGGFYAFKNYVLSIKSEINFHQWIWDEDDEPAKRSYFFGPGYVQLANVIKMAISLNNDSAKKMSLKADSWRNSDGIWGLVKSFFAIVFKVFSNISVHVIGTMLCITFGLLHGIVTVTVMMTYYCIFSVVWIVDRLYLIKDKIRADCPICHSRFLIPTFMCPDCGAIHKKLVPGPYGIWKHTCLCGNKIPSTFLNGRSKLDAYCPDCGSPLVASDVRPIVFQLVGGSKAGKTVYLSAFFHKYLQKLSTNRNLEITIADQYRPYFDELEEWYSGTDCPATTQLNSQMYPVLIDSPLGVKRQFSIYDIAGEMFDGFTADSEVQQQQFHYCDGLLFLIDPFSSGVLRMNKINSGEDVSDFSDMAVEDVATNFINYLIRTGHAKANSRCNIPIAILIAKADIKEVKRAIGPAKINSIFRNNTEQYGTYENARDSVCRQFLIDIGLVATVDNLETQFSNLRYFPVSAMGHSVDGMPYEPWGIMDAMEWMLPLADKELSDLITPPAVVSQ